MRFLFFWLITLGSVPLSIFRPYQGAVVYLFVTHLQMIAFMFTGNTVYYGPLIGGSLLLGYLAFETSKAPPPIHRFKLLILFFVWATIASLFALDRSLAMPKVQDYGQMFLITIVLTALASTVEKLRMFLLAMIGGLGLLGSKTGLVVLGTAGTVRIEGPGQSSLLTDNNDYAMAMCVGVVTAAVLARAEQGWIRNILRIMALLCAVSVIGTRSRGGFLGLAVAVVLISFSSGKKIAGFATLGAAVLAFVLFAPQEVVERYETIEDAAEQDESAIARIRAWETAMEMAKANPLFGVGLGNFQYRYNDYSPHQARPAHSAYFSLLGETGMPGLTLWLAFLTSTIWVMWRTANKLRKMDKKSPLAVYCTAIYLGLMVYMVPNITVNRPDWDFIYHLGGMAVASSLLAKKVIGKHKAEEEKAFRLRAAGA